MGVLELLVCRIWASGMGVGDVTKMGDAGPAPWDGGMANVLKRTLPHVLPC